MVSIKDQEAAVRKRSQSFPSFSLREAFTRLEALYEREKAHAVDRDTAARAIGYSSAVNGSAGRMLSTLQNFGLIETTGRGVIRITPLGLKYLRPVKDTDKHKAIEEAFRNPPLYSEVIEEYGANVDEMPSESTFRNWLLREEKLLSEDSADKFVAAFMESAEFFEDNKCSLTNNSKSAVDIKAEVEVETDKPVIPTPDVSPVDKQNINAGVQQNSGFNLSGTLSPTVSVSLSASGAIGGKELKRLKAWLETIAVPSVALAIECCEEDTKGEL